MLEGSPLPPPPAGASPALYQVSERDGWISPALGNVGASMADYEPYADDIAQLFGPREEAAVEPALDLPAADQNPAPSAGNGSSNGNGNGAHAGGKQQSHDMATLAEAIASRRHAAASRGDLDAMRSELEGTFAQQLAAGLYELMAASNDRLAAFEEQMNRQLGAVREAVGEQTRQVAGSVDSHRLAVSQEFDALRSQLEAVQGDLAGPVGAGTAFQREMRHEIGRLADLVAEQAGEAARRADVTAASVAEARTELATALEQSAGGAAKVSGELGVLSERVNQMQADIAALRQVVADLGETVAGMGKGSQGERDKARRRRGWSSAP